MESISIDTGVKRICINQDESRVVSFNPSDVLFAEKFYAMYRDFESKQKEFESRAKEIDAHTEVDENGAPANFEERLEFLKEICNFTFDRIDSLFGAGTSQTVFQGEMSVDAIAQFLEGITPFIEKERSEKVKKYTNSYTRSGKKVMK